ncbi:hypothetical protein HYC85_010439 [Camellia sinensis]|uniref:VQ domain-containing protein n=1 Tax=Camellia sinensis TaxID=4442 RepID=A0A7J7HIU5_CAMSI|nr:hypothetical protein HYC85_010439 [Camellia sinensis]
MVAFETSLQNYWESIFYTRAVLLRLSGLNSSGFSCARITSSAVHDQNDHDHHLKEKERMRKSSKRKSSEISVKVVHISSPVKVKTSASKFRALVQELTGRDSDVSRFVEETNSHHQNILHRGRRSEEGRLMKSPNDQLLAPTYQSNDSPTTTSFASDSDSFFYDDLLITTSHANAHVEESLMGLGMGNFP